MGIPARCDMWRAATLASAAIALVPPLSPPALAAAAPSVAAPTVLYLSQSAMRRLSRDRLRVEVRAERTAATPEAVEAAINGLMAKALAEARATAGVAVETGSYGVFRATPANAPARWTGQQSLSLTGVNAAVLLELAGRLQAEGLVMSNLAYEISPGVVHGAEDALTAEALAALQRRAIAIARQLHLDVVGYRDVTVGNAQSEGGPRPLFAAAQAAAVMPPPVGAAGETTVTVTVSADILLAPPRR
jgi:uncharacterized protein